MICEIFSRNKNLEWEKEGLIQLQNGRLVAKPAKPRYKRSLERLLDEPKMVDQGRREVTSKNDPEAWLRSLPGELQRCSMVGAKLKGDSKLGPLPPKKKKR